MLLRFLIVIGLFALLLPVIYRLAKRIYSKITTEIAENGSGFEDQLAEISDKRKKLKIDLQTEEKETKRKARNLAKLKKSMK